MKVKVTPPLVFILNMCYAFCVVILHYTGGFNEIGHLSGRGPSFGVAV